MSALAWIAIPLAAGGMIAWAANDSDDDSGSGSKGAIGEMGATGSTGETGATGEQVLRVMMVLLGRQERMAQQVPQEQMANHF